MSIECQKWWSLQHLFPIRFLSVPFRFILHFTHDFNFHYPYENDWKVSLENFHFVSFFENARALLIPRDSLAHLFYEIVYHLHAHTLQTPKRYICHVLTTLLVFCFPSFGWYEVQFSVVYFLFEYIFLLRKCVRLSCARMRRAYNFWWKWS